jgi:YesN/AraC family two-component response regulator
MAYSIIDKSIVVVAKEYLNNFYSALSNEETSVSMVTFPQSMNTVQKKRADVVLLDCGHDGDNGLVWLSEFKTYKKDVPVIFITSIRSHDVVMHAYKLGVRDYFIKPVSISELNRLITELLFFKRNSLEKRMPLPRIHDVNKHPIGSKISDEMLSDIPKNMANVVQYIEENISRPLNLNELANLAGLTKFHFLRKFKRLTGFSPLEYVILLRMHKAKKLLLERNFPVSSVAGEVGYCDLRNFDRRFKQHTGFTPSSYRKTFLNNL